MGCQNSDAKNIAAIFIDPQANTLAATIEGNNRWRPLLNKARANQLTHNIGNGRIGNANRRRDFSSINTRTFMDQGQHFATVGLSHALKVCGVLIHSELNCALFHLKIMIYFLT